MGSRGPAQPPLKLSGDNNHLAVVGRPRTNSGGSPTGSIGRSVTFVEAKNEFKKSRSIRLSVIGLAPLNPELMQQMEEEVNVAPQPSAHPKVHTPRRESTVWKRNTRGVVTGTAPQGQILQRQRRGQPELRPPSIEEDGVCILPASAFSFSSVGELVHSWGPNMVSRRLLKKPTPKSLLDGHACVF